MQIYPNTKLKLTVSQQRSNIIITEVLINGDSHTDVRSISYVIINLFESTAGQRSPPTFSTHLYQLPVYSKLLQ